MPDQEIKERIVKMRYGMEIGYGQEIVRCRDCKHFHYMKCSYPERGRCDLWHMLHWGDWYCADGERRDEDA